MSSNTNYVEIPIFFIMLSVCIQGPVLTNLIIFRSCYVDLGYNVTECALLGTENMSNNTQTLEKLVQPFANVLSLVANVPSSIICTILALFIGCWSDKFGRKPVILLTILGQIISSGVAIIFCLLPNISAWYITTMCIPIILSGGFASALTVFLSYITDITDENNRGVRMGIFEGVLSIGMLVGMMSSSYVFNAIGYTGIFVVSVLSYTFAFLYSVFVIDESLTTRETEGKFKAFFNTQQIKDMGVTTFKQRENHKRTLIILCLIITSLFISVVMSEGNYMFLRLKFGWSLKQYTLFSSARDVLSILGTFIGIYGIHKLLKVDECIVIIMGLMSCIDGSLVQGLASTSAHIYFGGMMRLLTGNVSPMLRSLISKIAEPDEVGKIFSVLVMCENFLQMLSSPMYTYIYNATLDTHPEAYNYVSAGILSVAVILTIIVAVLHLKRKDGPKVCVSNGDSVIVNESDQLIC